MGTATPRASGIRKPLIAAWVACALVVAFAAVWTRAIPGESLIALFAQKDTRIQEHIWSIDIVAIRHMLRFQFAAWALIVALALTWRWSSEDVRTYLRPRIFQWSMGAACSCGLFLLLVRAASERTWYPIDLLMTNPSSVPIFGQRLLFVWLADAAKAIDPSLSTVNAYYLSQIPAVLLTVWMMGRWTELYAGRSLRWAGQVLTVLMLAMTFDYYTFYDVAVVFFFTAGLYLLRQRHYTAFVAVLAVGTLNHENISLLIVVALLETARRPKLCAAVCGAASGAYFTVRAMQQHFMPFDRHVDWRLWSNLYYPLFGPKIIAGAAASLFFWWIAAAVSWRSGDVFLKRATILFPLLLGVTYLFGQFQEPRQFDAFLPVVVGFLVSRAAAAFRNSSPRLVAVSEEILAGSSAP